MLNSVPQLKITTNGKLYLVEHQQQKNFKNFAFVESRSLTWTNGKILKLKKREKLIIELKLD